MPKRSVVLGQNPTNGKDIELAFFKTADLKGAAYNPRRIRKNQMAGLKASLGRFGLVDLPVWNRRTKRLVSGHQRLTLLRQKRVGETPVIVVDLPEAEEKALNLTLNNPAVAGEWTRGVLAVLADVKLALPDLTEQLRLPEIRLQLDGQPGGGVKPGKSDPDEVPEPPKKSVAKPGEVWVLGRHRVVCGDSLREEVVAKVLRAQAAMAFTDPPYNVDDSVSKKPKHKIRKIEGDKQTPAAWLKFCQRLGEVLREHVLGDCYVWGAPGPDGMKQRLAFVDMGGHWSATIIWEKQQMILSPANYQRIYEPCFYGWFGPRSSWVGDRKQVEVWHVNRPFDSDAHPTMKPVELCVKGIRNSCRPGDTVLDLFLGSGSTLIACEQSDRTCVGVEIEPRYVDVTVARWEKFTGKRALRA